MMAWFAKLTSNSIHVVQTAIKITGLKQNQSFQATFDQCVLLRDLAHFISKLTIVN